jgi:hypothetical protein
VTVDVRLADAEPNGLAEMVAGLLRSNLERRPERGALLRPATVALEALDAGVGAAIRLGPGRVELANEPPARRADVRIRAESRDLLALSSAPLRLGYPDPLRPQGRAVLAGILRGRVRISGLVRHPVVVSRFARLLSVA